MSRRELVWVSNLLGEQTIVVAEFLDIVHDERLDQSESLQFDIPASDERADFIVEDGEVRWRDRRFMVRKVQLARAGSEITLHVECDALWYRLAEKVRPGSVNLSGVTIADGLTTILDGSGWSLGEGSSTSATLYSMELQDATVLALVRKWATITSSVVTFDTSAQQVTMAATRGRDLGVGFRYARNLTRIRREVEPPYATRLFPYGAQELNVAGVNGGEPYVEDFSWYTSQGLTLEQAEARFLKTRVWSDPTFVVDTELLAAAEVKMAAWAQPTVRYECDVVDLSEISGVHELLAVGDTVRVADEPLGLDVRTTVVRRQRYPLEPWRDRVELDYLPSTVSDGSDTSRDQSSIEWLMFKSDIGADYTLRNDGTYLTNRIGLSFRAEGEAVFGFDVNGTGVGAGTLTITLYDAETDAELHSPLVIAYTDGVAFHENATWAMKDLEGQYDVRVRMVADSSGAASPTNGVNIDTGDARLWVLAHGAVQQTPTVANSQVFDWNGSTAVGGSGSVQQFTVPDNVTEITVECKGAAGGYGTGGSGCVVSAKFPVVPGTVYDVYAAGSPATQNSATGRAEGGFPDGGDGQGWLTSDNVGGGGGSSSVRPTGSSFVDSLIVAGGGGGEGENATDVPGVGGFFAGGDSTAAGTGGGYGGTQFAGGAAPHGGPIASGTFGQGGTGYPPPSIFNDGGGGGGGGWYGGSGGGSALGGGGGSGWIDSDSNYYDLLITDGGNAADGQVTISWEDPLEGV
jgi:phage minor structural protein